MIDDKTHVAKLVADELSKKDKLIIGAILLAVMLFSIGYFTGNYFNKTNTKQTQIDKLESYLALFHSQFGNGTCEDKRSFQTSLGIPNFPCLVAWKQNITINQAIGLYESYKPGSQVIAGIILKNICNGR